MRFGNPLGVLVVASAMFSSQSIEVTTVSQPDLNTPRHSRKDRRLRSKHRHRLGKVGRTTVKPGGYSVKSWARYLTRNCRDAVPIRSPEKFMHAVARRRFLFAQTSTNE